MIDASEGDEDGEMDDHEDTPSVKTSNKGRKLTDVEIVAHCLAFIFAGTDTVASVLACTSYLLALNPDVQEKLQSEIDGYFDDKPVSYTMISACLSVVLSAFMNVGCLQL